MSNESPSSVAEQHPPTTVESIRVAERAPQYIEILDEQASFTWQYTDDRGTVYATKFKLRLISDEEDKVGRKRYTTIDRSRGQRHEVLNGEAFGDAMLNLCVLGWTDMKRRDARGNQVDVPFDPRYIRAIPERIKADILRLCVGKEAALENVDTNAGNG